MVQALVVSTAVRSVLKLVDQLAVHLGMKMVE